MSGSGTLGDDEQATKEARWAEMAGVLVKHSVSRGDNWRRRLFVLHEGRLEYYKAGGGGGRHGSMAPLGVFYITPDSTVLRGIVQSVAAGHRLAGTGAHVGRDKSNKDGFGQGIFDGL